MGERMDSVKSVWHRRNNFRMTLLTIPWMGRSVAGFCVSCARMMEHFRFVCFIRCRVPLQVRFFLRSSEWWVPAFRLQNNSSQSKLSGMMCEENRNEATWLPHVWIIETLANNARLLLMFPSSNHFPFNFFVSHRCGCARFCSIHRRSWCTVEPKKKMKQK